MAPSTPRHPEVQGDWLTRAALPGRKWQCSLGLRNMAEPSLLEAFAQGAQQFGRQQCDQAMLIEVRTSDGAHIRRVSLKFLLEFRKIRSRVFKVTLPICRHLYNYVIVTCALLFFVKNKEHTMCSIMGIGRFNQ
ncbi:hypothetical protein NDU88_005437 [Pleurodeles waltl]|uniref:Uncharacterized protein n=1 Tax=Pleurodeles waltl TaxID=8319 RepID=A0AAV7VLP7_PLEWA|nr:hypothetical protein NDU88_005437 [Pleurodeles waltl]